MIERIDLSNFKLVSNRVLVKLDPAFDMIVINGPEGKKIELQLISTADRAADHYSISGKIVARPKDFYYFDKPEQEDIKAGSFSMHEYSSSMMATAQVKTDYDFKVGDKVYFNYNSHLNAEAEYRIVDTDEFGICMLVMLDSLFGYEKDGEIIPVNGYVFFKRDQDAAEINLPSGIVGIRNVDKYSNFTATVVSADKPVKAYFDGGADDKVDLKKGDRILISPKAGYRMAYDIHAEELKSVEVCYRKHVLAIIEPELAEV